MSDTPFEPTYLRQGSCLMVFKTPEAAAQAHSACVTAFNNRQSFAGFTLRPPLEPLPDWMRNGQPCQPWLVLEHRCIIFGLANLPETSTEIDGLTETLILEEPPIIVGNTARNYGLITLRNQQVKLDAQAPANAPDNLVILQVRAA